MPDQTGSVLLPYEVGHTSRVGQVQRSQPTGHERQEGSVFCADLKSGFDENGEL